MSALDPSVEDARTVASIVSSVVIPRPIAWVSTVDRTGRRNLAPHSFFSIVSGDPPILQFTSMVDQRHKDSLANVLATGEFVVNIATRAQLEALDHTSAELAPEVDEFDWADLVGIPGSRVRAHRVAGASAALECVLVDSLQVGSGHVVFGRVVYVHVSDTVFDSAGRVSPRALAPLARLGGPQYATLGEVIPAPPPRTFDHADPHSDAAAAPSGQARN